MIAPTPGPAALAARLSEIQARFSTAPTPVSSTASTPSSSTDFSAVLSAAMGTRRILPWASLVDTPVASSAAVADETPFAELFEAAGARHGVPPRLLSALAKVESNFRTDARSRAGAIGLMQFMPSTAAGMGIDPLDPAQAIDGAARLLASHKERFGSWELALAAYNAGPGNVTKYGGIPPFAETRAHVSRVLGLAFGESS